MSLRIRLLEPRPAGPNVYDYARLPRLGLPLIGAMLAETGHDVRIYTELLGPVDLGDCLAADLVGISSTTATQPAAYKLADLLGQAGVPVVLGGPHVTFCADEALEHAPFVVRGEGEATMAELVGQIEHGGDLDAVRGLSFLADDGSHRHNPGRAAVTQEEYELLPDPALGLIEGHSRMTTTPVMTQRGCPFDCEFCSVTAMFTRRVRYRRPDQVVAELAGLGAERVFFYDDNFVVNRARTKELLRGMLARDLTPAWMAQVRADAALRSPAHPDVDDELLSLMRDSGCSMVMIGIEAATDEGLANVTKRLTVSTIERSVDAFHRHGIAIHGMFVAGLDTDTRDSARSTAAFARRLGIETFQLMVETPLPGTKLWQRASEEQRILSDDWSLFDGHQVVMRPRSMTPLELQIGVLDAMRRFYSWPAIARSGIASALTHLPDLATAVRPSLLRQLPAMARLARARRWEDMAPIVDRAVPAQVRSRIGSAMWLPAIRLYARRQLTSWWDQERSRSHLALLASQP